MFDYFTLPNGLQIIGQRLEAFHSVAMGLWVRAGSVDETPAENGMSHMIEHMLFKGTPTRTARQIAQEMDAIGGQLNAFTSKESTCYYAHVMDIHMEKALALLSDILLNSTLDEKELKKEKGVILEEISMVEDTPEDMVHELLSKAYFGEHPLGKTILGPADQVREYTRDDLLAYKDKFYAPDNTILSIAGNYDLEKLKDLCQSYLGGYAPHERPARPEGGKRGKHSVIVRQKPIEQLHLCLAYECPPMDSPLRYPLSVMNNFLGGGMSSRMFQRIREDLGMAYSVYTYPSVYTNNGLFAVYAGLNAQNGNEVVDAILHEISILRKDGVDAEEFEQARQQLRGGYILGQESASSRMMSIGRAQLLTGKVRTDDEVLEKIDAVTIDQVMASVEAVFASGFSASAVGKMEDGFQAHLEQAAAQS